MLRFIDHRSIAAMALIVAGGLHAASAAPKASTPDTAHYPTVLRQMVDAGQMQVLRQFPTDKPGMTGYVVQHNGYQTVVYGEDGYLMLGPLFGPNGKNLSKRDAAKYQPTPDVGQAIQSLDSDTLITQGPDDAPTLYAFVDPDCGYCHRFYQRAMPLVRAGRLRIQWIMVGVLGPSSVRRAAAILAADDPEAALANDEAGFNAAREQGGITPAAQPDAAVLDVLDQHRQAMTAVGGSGTPTIAYTDGADHWTAHVGVPPRSWLMHYADAASPKSRAHP